MNIAVLGPFEQYQKLKPWFEQSGHFKVLGYYDPEEKSNHNYKGELLFFDDFCTRIDAVYLIPSKKFVAEDLAVRLIKNGVHILMEGFGFSHPSALNAVQRIQTEASVCVQFTGLMRNTPMLAHHSPSIQKIRYVKADRFLHYNNFHQENRINLEIFNLADLLTSCIDSPVQKVKVTPFTVFGNLPDVIKINVEFNNSADAELVIGSIESNEQFTAKFFGSENCYEFDFLNNTCHQLKQTDNSSQLAIPGVENTGTRNIERFEMTAPWFDVFQQDIRNFYFNVVQKRTPTNGLHHLSEAARLQSMIIEKLERNLVKN